MELVPTTENDKEYFYILCRLVYRDLVEKQIGMWDEEIERTSFDNKWSDHGFKKIIYNGEMVGGIWVQEFKSHFQLREIQIHPKFQNQGIGTKLLNLVIERARKAEKELRLRVLTSSRATELYKRLGFIIVGQSDTQYYMTINS
jgi:ribosomal protein S18 acetylase RimI-like enzyme